MGSIGATELIIFLLVILLLFGSTKLPKLAKSLGEAQKEFKKGIAEVDEPPAKALSEDKVTLTRAELDAMLAEREAQARKDTPPAV